MSLILDALRKSEAERRRGQAPSLYSATPVPTTRARPAWLRLLPVVALGVLLLVGLMAWFDVDEEPVTKDELTEEAPSLLPPSPAQLAAKAGVESSAPPPAAAAPIPPPAPASTRAPPPSVDALVKPPVAPPVATAPPPTPVIVAPEPAPASAPAEASLEPLPPVAVLDAGTRSSLPAMKMSMHVYNDDPSRRFATIDGQRVTEGSRLGSATVVEIRRDGVVLDVGGQRVLLPKP
jgi:general secretion pathway protein B